MITLVAFDLDGTLAESKQALLPSMGKALADLLAVAQVAVISGGDWPQFHKQIVSQLPAHADVSKLWLMPTTGTKLYTFTPTSKPEISNTQELTTGSKPETPLSTSAAGTWAPVYAELFTDAQKTEILTAFDAALAATGFTPEQTWGPRIEDRGSQITFSALGQLAPISAKEVW